MTSTLRTTFQNGTVRYTCHNELLPETGYARVRLIRPPPATAWKAPADAIYGPSTRSAPRPATSEGPTAAKGECPAGKRAACPQTLRGTSTETRPISTSRADADGLPGHARCTS